MNQLHNQAAIRVVIVDDDSFVRSSLSTILGADQSFEICAQGGSSNEAIALYQQHKPDIMLMDIQMPEKSGLEGAREILALHPDARIVFLTTFSDEEYLVSALRMGAKGYLIKQEVAKIIPALHSVMNGQNVLGDEVMEHFDSFAQKSMHPEPSKQATMNKLKEQGLTSREVEVLELVAQGLDNKEIAAAAFMSEGTVRNHISSALQKLGLKNRTQLAIYYYRSF